MILYIQTPAIPRSELHEKGVIKALKFLDTCEHFSEIKWFVNIDVTTSHLYEFEDYKITKNTFLDFSKTLNKTKLSLNINKKPCFYLAFRYLTKVVQKSIKDNKLKNKDYCVMWLEDDWYMGDESGFNNLMDEFLNNNEVLVSILYNYKINMGGNPDIIKGKLFEKFDNINFDKDNKRDPEYIRRVDLFEKYIWVDPWPDYDISYYDKCTHINKSAIELDGITDAHEINGKVISSNVITDVGDQWGRNEGRLEKWGYGEKSGISKDRSYTYK